MRIVVLVLITMIFIFSATSVISALSSTSMQTGSKGTCGGDIKCECGDTLTSSQTMWYDLNFCPYGLYIGNDLVTLDCNNHTIKAIGSSSGSGIFINGRSGVNVKNCNIEGFDHGIFIKGNFSVLENNHVYSNNAIGFWIVSGSEGTMILNNTITNNAGTGVVIQESPGNTIMLNNINNNGYYGVILQGSNFNQIADNKLSNNYYGIWLQTNSQENNIISNTIDDGSSGIYLKGSSNNNILANNISHVGVQGLKLSDEANNNNFNNNFVKDTGGYVVYISSSHYNTFWNNTFDNVHVAYEYDADSNYWNLSDIGNLWSEFVINPGYPDFYDILGGGDGIDWHPRLYSDCYSGVQCECRDTVTSDYVMWYDVTDCSGSGMIIGTDNITLDCNGHLIGGSGNRGILLKQKNNVTVKNCVLEGYFSGIEMDNISNSIMLNNTINSSFSGVFMMSGSNNTFTGNILIDSPIGFLINGGHNQLLDNHITGTGSGIILSGDGFNLISSNIFNDNSIGLMLVGNNNSITHNFMINNTIGIQLEKGSFNSINLNELIESSEYGVWLNNSYHNTFWNNTFMNNNMSTYEGTNTTGNRWNLSNVGNSWSDFPENSGYPNHYVIPGPGDGIDWHPIPLELLPDLTISSSDIVIYPQHPVEDKEIMLNTTVRNVGLAGTESFNVIYKIDGIPREIARISLGQGDSLTIQWAPFTIKHEGDHSIVVSLDVGNMINEVDETNNEAEKIIHAYKPNLRLLILPINWQGSYQDFLNNATIISQYYLERIPLADCSQKFSAIITDQIDYSSDWWWDNWDGWTCYDPDIQPPNCDVRGGPFGDDPITVIRKCAEQFKAKTGNDYDLVAGITDLGVIKEWNGTGSPIEPNCKDAGGGWSVNQKVIIAKKDMNIMTHELGHEFGLSDQYCDCSGTPQEKYCGPTVLINPLKIELGCQVGVGNGCCIYTGNGPYNNSCGICKANFDRFGIDNESDNDTYLDSGNRSVMGSYYPDHYDINGYDHIGGVVNFQCNSSPAKSYEDASVIFVELNLDKDDNVILKTVNITFGEPDIYHSEFGNYSLRILDDNNLSIYNSLFDPSFFRFSDPPQPTDFETIHDKVVYEQSMKWIEVSHGSDVIFSYQIPEFCNFNSICEENENYYSCPDDCDKSGEDDICQAEYDGICDPDCINGIDPDCFTCGDVNGQDGIDIDDIVYLISYIFSGGPEPIPIEAGDTDLSGNVDIDDVVYIINYVFIGGSEPCNPSATYIPGKNNYMTLEDVWNYLQHVKESRQTLK